MGQAEPSFDQGGWQIATHGGGKAFKNIFKKMKKTLAWVDFFLNSHRQT
jgi:hypothetical protein